MAQVPIPFVDREINTDDDATSIAVMVGLIIAGFALFAWAQDVGQFVATRVNSFITNMTGFDPTSGQDAGGDVL